MIAMTKQLLLPLCWGFAFLILSTSANLNATKLSPQLKEELQDELNQKDFLAFQPKVTIVEKQPQRFVYGTILKPEGSPWCAGNATIWFVGHQLYETPHCFDGKNWTTPGIAMMDLQDDLNGIDPRPPNIDRHDCTTVDVNQDGLDDIVCAVGAVKGTGFGFTELYLTQKDGSIVKMQQHGLQMHPSVRARFTSTLRNTPDNITHVFVSAFGAGRNDGLVNWHAMYRQIDHIPYFVEVPGPWNKHAKAKYVTVADWNQDGRDDFIVMHNRNWTIFFEQEPGGFFRKLNYEHSDVTFKFRSARVADMNLDGFPDLVVVTDPFRISRGVFSTPHLRIFPGINSTDRFNFTEIYFEMELPYAAPDIEILDVNEDGVPDIYVVLTDESQSSYCGTPMPWRLRPQPPLNWTAPLDLAQDLLLLGKNIAPKVEEERYRVVTMGHLLNGCGYLAKTYGDKKTMVLANAGPGHAGSSALLQW